jgi:phenylpropionate dioxygenase-like ring-hydroxylating dioxygenase large terminal subunit
MILKKSTTTALHQRLLTNLANNNTDLAERQENIAVSVFSDTLLLAKERQALFLDTPQPVAFSGELPEPGSYLALQVLDIPVLLVRDETGKLGAFINACAHRGAPVAAGSGNARSLVCPFHGWAYNTDGTLRGRPEEDCFNAASETPSLPPLAVSERHGVVVVGISQAVLQQSVDNALDDIGEELAAFGFEGYRPLERKQFETAANWKLINDLSLESYHFKVLHRDSVAQMLDSNAVVDTFGRHSRWAFPLNSIRELADIDEKDWPDTLQGSCTYTLYPGVMLIVNSLGAQMIRAEPTTTPGHSRVSYAGIYKKDCDADTARQAFEFGGDVFANEDLPMAEECQRGLAAREGEIPLGRNEALLQFWHQLWRDAVAVEK